MNAVATYVVSIDKVYWQKLQILIHFRRAFRNLEKPDESKTNENLSEKRRNKIYSQATYLYFQVIRKGFKRMDRYYNKESPRQSDGRPDKSNNRIGS